MESVEWVGENVTKLTSQEKQFPFFLKKKNIYIYMFIHKGYNRNITFHVIK